MEPTSLPRFQDLSLRWIAYAASSAVVFAIGFGFVHEVELKQDVRCEIVSDAEIKIQGVSGLVTSLEVAPHARVAQGTPLFHVQRDFSLSSDGRQRALFDTQSRDDQLRAADEQFAQRSAQIAAQLSASRVTESTRRAQIGALDGQIAQIRLLTDEYTHRFERLQSVSDYVSAERIEQAHADLHQQRIALGEGLARREQLRGEIGTQRTTQTELEAQRRELDARHARELQDIQMRFEQSRLETTIAAPKAGVVAFSNLVAGHVLEPSDVALVLATGERGTLRAALRIPSRRRGFVQPGQIIRLKFDAFPYAKFGSYEARIDEISATTVQSSAGSLGGSAGGSVGGSAGDIARGGGADEDVYIAWAMLRGHTFDYERQHLDILPGMQATASIVVERRTLAGWVFEPLFRMIKG
jgi:membrane fusion protein